MMISITPSQWRSRSTEGYAKESCSCSPESSTVAFLIARQMPVSHAHASHASATCSLKLYQELALLCV